MPSSRAHHSEGYIQEGTCHFSQYLSQPATRHLSQGHSSYLPDMSYHLFLITQPLHTILYSYLHGFSSQLGSKQMGLLISLLWALAEGNEFWTLGEKLKTQFCILPTLESDGEGAQGFQSGSHTTAQLKIVPKAHASASKVSWLTWSSWGLGNTPASGSLCAHWTQLYSFLQNFTFNDDFSPSSTSSADLSGVGAEPKTPGLSQSLALSSDEVLWWPHGRT